MRVRIPLPVRDILNTNFQVSSAYLIYVKDHLVQGLLRIIVLDLVVAAASLANAARVLFAHKLKDSSNYISEDDFFTLNPPRDGHTQRLEDGHQIGCCSPLGTTYDPLGEAQGLARRFYGIDRPVVVGAICIIADLGNEGVDKLGKLGAQLRARHSLNRW